MGLEKLAEKIAMLEFHQKLLLQMISGNKDKFNKLIIQKAVTEKELTVINELCEKLSIELEEQKAEGFVHFHPLFEEFTDAIRHKLQPKETVHAMFDQGIFMPLMTEFKKYV
ncbi:DUF1878 family protein [Bacillus sp. T33-2]|uniref:DUF1878 family protein n=1 Tax=Bacillus sp. T33-2 TaxID=2054168 RepID=UPI0015E117F0|nr:DUF1878 family protein [Bacillus sp. T33-2]